RESGFSLFDLETYRYSRAALPSRFTTDQPGATAGGQLWWGNFLYFRDLAMPAYEENWDCRVSPSKVLKLACCFESYDLHDCAAELLLKYREQVSALVDVETCLDLLARGADADSRSYSEHMERFRGNLRAFFPPPPASPTHGERRQGRGPIRWIR